MQKQTERSKRPEHLGRRCGCCSVSGAAPFSAAGVAVLVIIRAVANLLGTYMIRPVSTIWQRRTGGAGTGRAADGGHLPRRLAGGLGYTQTMVKVAQKVLFDIRRDLFAHLQKLPLRFLTPAGHGDVMSYVTNDVDTISDALNNSVAMVIQSFIQVVGTLTMLFSHNWRLSFVVTAARRNVSLHPLQRHTQQAYYQKQQTHLGDLDGYIEEMVAGQKLSKVLTTSRRICAGFLRKMRAPAPGRYRGPGLCRDHDPAVVSISYINYAIVAALGGYMAMKGMTDVGSLASYLVFVRQAALPINQFTQQSNFLLAALAGQSGALTPCPKNRRSTRAKPGWSNRGPASGAWQKPDGQTVPLRGDVRFEHVNFGYEADHPILKT